MPRKEKGKQGDQKVIPEPVSRRRFLKEASIIMGGAAISSLALTSACGSSENTTTPNTTTNTTTYTNTNTNTTTTTTTATTTTTSVTTSLPPAEEFIYKPTSDVPPFISIPG
jgi:hypothetical protein